MPELQLAMSNIAWDKSDDETMYGVLRDAGFTGLEIAPTRIFPEQPYDCLSSAALFGGYLKQVYGLSVPSLQSIWYGRGESIFDPEGAEALLDYSAEAFQFAHILNCPSLVFGCPRNRALPVGRSAAEADEFFQKVGTLAARYGVRFAVEPNAPEYTNFLNTTREVVDLVKRLDNPGLSVNLDLGALLTAGERLRDFVDDLRYVSHIHISEPGLAPITRRPEHNELAMLLKAVGYRGFVSVEMRRPDEGLDAVRRTVDYIAEVFA